MCRSPKTKSDCLTRLQNISKINSRRIRCMSDLKVKYDFNMIGIFNNLLVKLWHELFPDRSRFFSSPQALLHTRNVSAEEAAMYYFNKLENEVPIS